MTTVVKIIEKRVENIYESRANIKVCTKLSQSVKHTFTELVEVTDLIRNLKRQFVGGKKF